MIKMIYICKHDRRRRRTAVMSAILLACILLICTSLLSSVNALPDGFVSELVYPRTDATMGVFAPNLRSTDHVPMMFVASKEGRVRVLENFDTSNDNDNLKNETLVLDLSEQGKLCDNGQRGIHSIAVHPNFLETRWVYLYYTRWREGCLEDASLGPQNILVRYTMNSTSLQLENEELLMEGGVLKKRIRNGGAMMFGTDGLLYLATGDGGVRANAQDRSNLQGSLLRLTEDGRIPEDNPYAGTGFPCGKTKGKVSINVGFIGREVYCSEIYSWGFRNPIRMALNSNQSDTNTTLFSISDVGADRFEELSWAGTEFREKNYGWPEWEGPCAFNSRHCPPPSPDSNLVDPFHYYAHASPQNGGSVAASAFVPDGTWPSDYKYVFMDTDLQTIFNLVEDQDSECRESCSTPTSAFVNTTFYESTDGAGANDGRLIDMFFGPFRDSTALYVIKHNKRSNYNLIHRIQYIGVEDKVAVSMPSEADVSSRFEFDEGEHDRKPFKPDISKLSGEEIELSQAIGNSGVAEVPQNEENITYSLKPSWKWLIGLSMIILLIALIYLGFKYYRLKRKVKKRLSNSSSPGFQEKPVPSKVASSEIEDVSTFGDVVCDEIKISSTYSTGNTSLSSTSTSFQQSAIWEKIAEETERRAKLRAKYTSGTPVERETSPKTPETMATTESPAKSEPSPDQSISIDGTLLKLDDLLAKCFARKAARRNRKEGRNDDSFEEDDLLVEEGTMPDKSTESEAKNIDTIESSANDPVTPVWLLSKSSSDSPIEEKKEESFVEATFSMTSLHSAGSSQDVSNESSATRLPEVSNNSNQSLLIFQDNDLSMSNKGICVNESDEYDYLMEAGIVKDCERPASTDMATFEEHYLLGDLDGDAENSNRNNHSLLIENRGDITITDVETTKKSDLMNNEKHHLLIENGGDIITDGEATEKSDLTNNEKHRLLIENGYDLEGNGESNKMISSCETSFLTDNAHDCTRDLESADKRDLSSFYLDNIASEPDGRTGENENAAENNLSGFYLDEVVSDPDGRTGDEKSADKSNVSSFYPNGVISDPEGRAGDEEIADKNNLSGFYLDEVASDPDGRTGDEKSVDDNNLSGFYLDEVASDPDGRTGDEKSVDDNNLSGFYLDEVANDPDGRTGDEIASDPDGRTRDEESAEKSNLSGYYLDEVVSDPDGRTGDEESAEKSNLSSFYLDEVASDPDGRKGGGESAEKNNLSIMCLDGVASDPDRRIGGGRSAEKSNLSTFYLEEVASNSGEQAMNGESAHKSKLSSFYLDEITSDKENNVNRKSLTRSEERRLLIKRVDDLCQILGEE